MPRIKVFKYIEQLDAFVPTEEYRQIADRIGLMEWNPVVWIGRLFMLDNDYGEHWFDNWEERETLEEKAKKLGIQSHQLLIVVPDKFKNDKDGPCHPPKIRKRFWTDVLKSLELSYDTLFEEARFLNAQAKEYGSDEFIDDLENRINRIRKNLQNETTSNLIHQEKNSFTKKQGQYLAFIHHYNKIHGCPPAEADMQRYFKVSPPTVHQMILTLEKRHLIHRVPGQSRTIRVLLPPEYLPVLEGVLAK